ncbi:MAG: hypothetical protein ACOYMG_00290, partial [Candidatus Methylumidiphilus sp.]
MVHPTIPLDGVEIQSTICPHSRRKASERESHFEPRHLTTGFGVVYKLGILAQNPQSSQHAGFPCWGSVRCSGSFLKRKILGHIRGVMPGFLAF